MFIKTLDSQLPLTISRLARLEGARNTRLTCVSGLAWITTDGDLRDIVLEPGQAHVVDSDAPVIVFPLRDGRPLELRIDAAPARNAPPQRGFAAVVGRLRSLFVPARAPVIAVA